MNKAKNLYALTICIDKVRAMVHELAYDVAYYNWSEPKTAINEYLGKLYPRFTFEPLVKRGVVTHVRIVHEDNIIGIIQRVKHIC